MAVDHESVSPAITRVIADVARRLADGERLSDDDLLATYPEVPADELKLAMARLRRIAAAQDEQHSDATCVMRPEASGDPPTGDNRPPSYALPARVDRFIPKTRLGAGSFGTVYLAHDPHHDCDVALKVSKASIHTPDDEAFFRREARAAARLNHVGIVHIRESGFDHDRFFMVSDYIEGRTLESMIASDEILIDRAVRLVIAICGALDHAHAHGVIHRDLKPANIIVDRKDNPLLMDFGLAKRNEGEATLTIDGNMVGTIAYMSPQQAEGDGHNVDARTDLYSAGVILFELLTRERPFRGTPGMIQRQLVEEAPPSPRSLNDNIPRDLETIVLRCLEKEPASRFASASELAAELSRFLAGEPILSRPITRAERVWRWAKRRPAYAGLAAAIGLILVMALVGSAREIYLQRRAKVQLQDNLLTTADLYGRRGEWTRALDQIDQAAALGDANSVRFQIARVRALEALNRINESRLAIDQLAARDDLGPQRAIVEYIHGISLLSRGEHKQGMATLASANRRNQLPSAESAIIKGLIADDSATARKYFEASLAVDPYSHDAHGLLIFTLGMAGEDELALTRLEVAELIYPEDPNFPLLAAFIEGKRGRVAEARRHLESPACRQLEPRLLAAYRVIIENFGQVCAATMALWDFTNSAEYEHAYAAEEAAATKVQQAIAAIGSYQGPTAGESGIINLVRAKGPACYEKACEPLLDLASLQTMGFLRQGVGDTERIDGIITRLAESSTIHPDGFFDFARGRLLYERGRFAEASDAFERAAGRRSMLGDFNALAGYAGARCEFERFQKGVIDSLDRACAFIEKRLALGDISPAHAKALFAVALAAHNANLAARLADVLTSSGELEDDARLMLAEVDVETRRYQSALEILNDLAARNVRDSHVRELRERCLKGLREFMREPSDGL